MRNDLDELINIVNFWPWSYTTMSVWLLVKQNYCLSNSFKFLNLDNVVGVSYVHNCMVKIVIIMPLKSSFWTHSGARTPQNLMTTVPAKTWPGARVPYRFDLEIGKFHHTTNIFPFISRNSLDDEGLQAEISYLCGKFWTSYFEFERSVNVKYVYNVVRTITIGIVSMPQWALSVTALASISSFGRKIIFHMYI